MTTFTEKKWDLHDTYVILYDYHRETLKEQEHYLPDDFAHEFQQFANKGLRQSYFEEHQSNSWHFIRCIYQLANDLATPWFRREWLKSEQNNHYSQEELEHMAHGLIDRIQYRLNGYIH